MALFTYNLNICHVSMVMCWFGIAESLMSQPASMVLFNRTLFWNFLWFRKILHLVIFLCQDRSCETFCWMKDEQLINVSISCLCLCIWLLSAHVRGTFYFILFHFFSQVKVTSEKGFFSSACFSQPEPCLLTPLTSAWAQRAGNIRRASHVKVAPSQTNKSPCPN